MTSHPTFGVPPASARDFDEGQLRAVRERLVAADNANDVRAYGEILADDAVIMHPQGGTFEGKDACLGFISDVLTSVGEEFEKRPTYRTDELRISGDVAVERGTFSQTLTRRSGSGTITEGGKYLWVFARQPDGAWKLSQLAGNLTQQTETAAANARAIDRESEPSRRARWHPVATVGQVITELAIVFVAVFGAFLADNYREQLSENEHRRQLAAALAAALQDANVHGIEVERAMSRTLAEFERARTAGQRPDPPVFREPGAERPPIKAWEAIVASGGARLIDAPLFFELALFYNRFESFGEKYQRYVVFTESRVLPAIGGDKGVFYEDDGRTLRGEFREYVHRLEDLRNLDRQLVEEANLLRRKLQPLIEE